MSASNDLRVALERTDSFLPEEDGLVASRQRLDFIARSPLHSTDAIADHMMRLPTQDSEPIVLVLDNLQEISNQSVHDAFLGFMSEAPDNLRILAATREDPPWPLARLQLDGRLAIVRAAELAFDHAEAAALFHDNGGGPHGEFRGDRIHRSGHEPCRAGVLCLPRARRHVHRPRRAPGCE